MEETEEKGLDDTLAHLLEWTHRNVSMYFKHKEFKELLEKKPKSTKERKGSAKQKPRDEPGLAFWAGSGSSDSSSEGVGGEVRYQTQEKCPKCSRAHPLFKCEEFYDQLPYQRRSFVESKKLCILCYSANHEISQCKMTNYKCRFGCKGRHNSDLHLNSSDYKKLVEATKEAPIAGPSLELANLVHTMDREAQGELYTLFCTAREEARAKEIRTRKVREMAVTTMIVEVSNHLNGKTEAVYAMVDSGASNTHMSSALGRRLGVHGTLAPFVVGSHGGRVQEYEVMECDVKFGAMDHSYQRTVTTKCYPEPCGQMEAVDWNTLQTQWEHLKFLPLPKALPNKRVEVIIGTDCLDAIEAIAPVVFGKEGEPCAKLSRLGWIVGGRTTPKDHRTEANLPRPSTNGRGQGKSGVCFFTREVTPEILEQSWAIEGPHRERLLANCHSPSRMTPLEKSAVERFKKRVKRENRCCTVPLMWKGSERPPDNYSEAKKLFEKQEIRMNQVPELRIKFQEKIVKWLSNEWADLVPLKDTKGFFIPTFMVRKTDRASTKYRLIMNGAYEFGGKCINDYLMPGPSRMNKVWEVMVKSRRKLYVLACDVESMFLNIRVDDKQDDPLYLRALFRKPVTGRLRALQCKTHVFGLNQSPYVAMEVVQTHVCQFSSRYPYAAEAVREDIIMDDVIHASDSKSKLLRTQKGLVDLFGEASMKAHKWVTNLPELWAVLPEGGKAKNYSFSPEEDRPCDFRPGFHPRKKELRSDGIVTRREQALVQERAEREAGKERGQSARKEEKGDPALLKKNNKEVRNALAELERAGERYQRMLADFAAKYDVKPDGEPIPKKPKKDDVQEEDKLPLPGPSGESAGHSDPPELKEHVLPQREEAESDGDAVEVRLANPDASDEEALRPIPTFSFRAPIPAVWPPQSEEEVRAPGGAEEVRPVGPAAFSNPEPPRGELPARERQGPEPCRPLPVIPRHLPGMVLGEGQNRELAPRIINLRPNRIRAPMPEPINRQGSRIGRPSTGSLATRERRMRRERAMRMGPGAGRDKELGNL